MNKWTLVRAGVVLLLLFFSISGHSQNPQSSELRPFEEAKWIWVEETSRDVDVYGYFRRSFHLSEVPEDFQFRITSDSQYQLYVNGSYVGRGPVRSDPRRKYFDVYEQEISNFLRPGKNVIAVKVNFIGQGTFSYILGKPGLLVKADGVVNGQPWTLVSDRFWRSLVSVNHRPETVRINQQLAFNEIYDSTLNGPENKWFEVGLDDASWKAATEVGPPNRKPFSQLLPRDIPFELNEIREAGTLVAQGRTSSSREIFINLEELIEKTSDTHGQVVYLHSNLYVSEASRMPISVEADQELKMWINSELVLKHNPREAGTALARLGEIHFKAGWNSILVKAVCGRSFRFIHGATREPLVFSAVEDQKTPGWVATRPYRLDLDRRILGLFPVWKDFDQPFLPEEECLRPSGCELDDRWKDVTPTTQGIQSIARRMASASHAAVHPEKIHRKDTSTWVLNPGKGETLYLVFDFQEEVNGYPIIEIESGSEGIVECGYSEELSGDFVNPYRASSHYADRFHADEGFSRWELFEKRAFRYMQIEVRGFEGPVRVKLPKIRFSTYPLDRRGQFSSSDPRLNEIWRASRHTLQMSMEDMFIDCPWRERTQWWGDARVQGLANYYHSGDPRLMRKGLRDIAYSQLDSGMMYATYPTSFELGLAPEFTLLWVVTLEEYHRYSNDLDLVNELYPRLLKAMEWFEKHENSHALLNDLPYLLWVDWADIDTKGEVTAINCYYVEALKRAATLASLVEDTESARRFLKKAEAVTDSINKRLWDRDLGVYRDARQGDQLSPVVSQQANTLAVLTGVAPVNVWDSILDYIHDPEQEVVASGTPFFSYYVLETLFLTGRKQKAMSELLRWYEMVQTPPGTFWEYWVPQYSRSHGWSCAPSIILPSKVLGVQMTEPAFQRFDIKPIFAEELDWARGSVPVGTDGLIEVKWERDADSFVIHWKSPALNRPRVFLPRLFENFRIFSYETSNSGGSRPASFALNEEGNWIIADVPSGGEYSIHMYRSEQ